MSQRPGPNALAFAATGALLVACLSAPAADASGTARFYGWVISGIMAMSGVVLGIDAIRSAEPRPSPWRSVGRRLAWTLRPRSWMLAWAAILTTAAVWGTPHLLFNYSPARCDYVGIHGVRVVLPAGSACEVVRWL